MLPLSLVTRIDTPGVIKRVSHLFNGHPSLILITFLPVGYQTECSTDAHDSNFITVTTSSVPRCRPQTTGRERAYFWSISLILGPLWRQEGGVDYELASHPTQGSKRIAPAVEPVASPDLRASMDKPLSLVSNTSRKSHNTVTRICIDNFWTFSPVITISPSN